MVRDDRVGWQPWGVWESDVPAQLGQYPALARMIYRGDVKAFEIEPVAVTDGIDARSKAVPVRLSVPLRTVVPGRYDCQVTVLEPNGQKVAFWRAPVAIVP